MSQVHAHRVCSVCCELRSDLLLCSKCHYVRYCSESCQRLAWKFHKATCTDMSHTLERADMVKDALTCPEEKIAALIKGKTVRMNEPGQKAEVNIALTLRELQIILQGTTDEKQSDSRSKELLRWGRNVELGELKQSKEAMCFLFNCELVNPSVIAFVSKFEERDTSDWRSCEEEAALAELEGVATEEKASVVLGNGVVTVLVRFLSDDTFGKAALDRLMRHMSNKYCRRSAREGLFIPFEAVLKSSKQIRSKVLNHSPTVEGICHVATWDDFWVWPYSKFLSSLTTEDYLAAPRSASAVFNEYLLKALDLGMHEGGDGDEGMRTHLLNAATNLEKYAAAATGASIEQWLAASNPKNPAAVLCRKRLCGNVSGAGLAQVVREFCDQDLDEEEWDECHWETYDEETKECLKKMGKSKINSEEK